MTVNLILTSDFPSHPTEGIVETIRAVARHPRVAWVAPASIIRRVRFLAARRIFRDLGISDLAVVDLVPGRSRWLANDFDVVYLSGGHPLAFRAVLRKSGLLAELAAFARSGALIVGASGGAMQVTPNISLHRLLKYDVAEVVAGRAGHAGLGLVGFEFLPHLNRHDQVFVNRVRAYSEAVPHDIVGVDDGGAISVTTNGAVSVIGRAVRFRQGVVSPFEVTA
jgi:peptidase E